MSTPRPVRIVEWNLAVYRRIWKSNILTSFLQPILYLLAMGVGVGTLVNANSASSQTLEGLSYVAYVAPGLLATTAMMVAAIESMYPVIDALVWGRQYEAIAATPLDADDIVSAHLLWMILRVGLAAGTVAAVMALFPDVRSWGLIPAVPVAVLTGLAFGMPLGAFTVTQRRDMAFPLIQRFVLVPLFLFGGAFFPLSSLPPFVRLIGYVTPLWHGVEVCRALTTDLTMSAAVAVGHIVYLLLWAVVGTVLMRRLTHRRLFT